MKGSGGVDDLHAHRHVGLGMLVVDIRHATTTSERGMHMALERGAGLPWCRGEMPFASTRMASEFGRQVRCNTRKVVPKRVNETKREARPDRRSEIE